MSEQDLIELNFERFDETAQSSGSPNDWYYYTLDIGGLTFISNASDEWESDGLFVEIMETDIHFRGSGFPVTIRAALATGLLGRLSRFLLQSLDWTKGKALLSRYSKQATVLSSLTWALLPNFHLTYHCKGQWNN